jgi:hypothetical protein
MSSSEFERHLPGPEDDLSLPSVQPRDLPDDFSKEELEFAQELEELFAFDQEELPPYFAQTLLQSEDPKFQVPGPRFEQKISTRVFRRLHLRRRLYRSSQPSFTALIKDLPVHRSFTALVAACLLFMVVTMIYTGPLFASGLSFLWIGAHSGVLQTRVYPQVTATPQHHTHTPSFSMIAGPKEIDYLQAQNELHFPIYLPETMPTNYDLNDIYLYQNNNQGWADGPLIQLSYTYQLPGVTPHGTGRIVICEFKPLGRVVQVVKFGSAQLMRLDGGHAQAVYVNGEWVRVNNASHDWVYGMRSELIYEHDGVVFWIVGDQRDGVDSLALSNIASSLQSFNMQGGSHRSDDLMSVIADSMNGSSWTYGFGGQIIYQDLQGAPSLNVVGAEPSQPTLDVPPNH